MHGRRRHPASLQHRASRLNHLIGPAEKPGIYRTGIDDPVEEGLDLGGVDATLEQRQAPALPAEDVNEMKAVGIAVLQTLELLEEHDAAERCGCRRRG